MEHFPLQRLGRIYTRYLSVPRFSGSLQYTKQRFAWTKAEAFSCSLQLKSQGSAVMLTSVPAIRPTYLCDDTCQAHLANPSAGAPSQAPPPSSSRLRLPRDGDGQKLQTVSPDRHAGRLVARERHDLGPPSGGRRTLRTAPQAARGPPGSSGAALMPAVQKLFEACKGAFVAGQPPTQQALDTVRALLDTFRPADVGLDEAAEPDGQRGFGFFGFSGRRGRHSTVVPRWSPPITYLHLYECDEFSMGIFCLPTSASIPLHNHPGMTVLSKLLYGSMHVRAYDWAAQPPPGATARLPRGARLARLVEDTVLSAPCATQSLHPTSSGNIHAFAAVTPCAVLDVLTPPYDAQKGRSCTYFREVPAPPGAPEGIVDGEGEGGAAILPPPGSPPQYGYLEEYQPPDDFVVQRGSYHGPRITA